MIKLDQFQIDGIKEIKLNNNVLVVAPTGAGKTLIANEAIKYYLEKNYKVFYTTPIKSLSNQKFNDFKNVGHNTGLLTGDRSINRDASLIIGTTEILRNMIFSKDDSIQETRLVVLDEVHYLGDRERGTTWEEIIIHAPKEIKFLCLSATISNDKEFLDWIVSTRGPTALIKSSIRPVPLEISLVAESKYSNNLKVIKNTRTDIGKALFKFEKNFKNFKKPGFIKLVNLLKDLERTPTIFFYFSRERVESKARELVNNLKPIDEKNLIRKEYEQIFADLNKDEIDLLNLDEQLWMWTRGVAYHHAGLAPIVKEFVEFLFLNKFINFLFATETLALGVNLPAKSIYIDRLFKYDGYKTRLLTSSEFLQLSGRAGRRGLDKKGFAHLSFDKNISNEWYNTLFKLKASKLESAFSVNYSSILNILNIYNEDEALKLLSKSFFAYQNNFDTKKLEDLFDSKLKVLKDLKIINTKKGEIIRETNRDSLLPAVLIYESNIKKDDIFYILFVSSGISSDLGVLNYKDDFEKIFAKFNSFIEKLNRTESQRNIAQSTSINFDWFSVFYEYIKTDNIEYTISKFNLNIGDFIKVAKECSELSKKLSILYKDENFELIFKNFNNKLIQKTMS